jgi:MFS superfamily sulfate permease-like transporter
MMARRSRRLRGAILRLVLRRWPAIVVGSLLLAPAIAMPWTQPRWPRPVEALAWIAGATGIALILAGLGGRQPDWDD